MQKIIINEQGEGQRIDKFLSEETLITRSQIQKKIKSGDVLVNNKNAKANYILKADDVVEIVEKVEDPVVQKEFEIDILFECEDYLIINKPVGLAVHPNNKHDQKSLTDYLIEKYPELERVGDDPDRPGIVHRLDQGVSGIMIIARNNKFSDHIKEQFKNRTVKKIYKALIHGSGIPDEGEINFPIERSKTDKTKMAALPLGEAGKEALTIYSVEKRYLNHTLLNVQIKTGRMHQIRVHFKALGHSIVGDRKYQVKSDKRDDEISRIFLHSSEIGFNNLAGERVEYKSSFPQELETYLGTAVK